MTFKLLAALAVAAILAWKRYLDYRAVIRSIQNHPGSRSVISPFGVAAFLFPDPIPGIYPGSLRTWYYKHRDFEECGVDIISAVSYFPKPEVVLQVADPAAIKEITTRRSKFPKSVHQYEILKFFGPNIVASEDEEWKHFRKTIAPAFSDRNNRVVWEETMKIVSDLFDKVWAGQKQIVLDNALQVTFPIALFVLSIAAFGRHISWEDEHEIPPNHKMTFKDALHIVSTDVVLKIATPEWIVKHFPTKRMKIVSFAFEELEQYMKEMIHERQTSVEQEERYDLLSSLLQDGPDGLPKLTDQELLGNVFIFLMAGHETAAHTLCLSFGLLALYPDKQERLYRHIKSVIPDGRQPRYEEMSLLTESIAVFYETLRLFPPAHSLPKRSVEDTTLVTTDDYGNKVVVPCPKDATLVLHIPGVHYNPRYWEDPYEFKPERFLGNWPRDAFLPFSSGARACLGRRFFEAQGIAILTMLVLKYKIKVKEEPEFAGESFEERKERVLKTKAGLTLTPVRVPIVLTRRDEGSLERTC
ncbi:hypothetical protein PHLGIDRAFT_131022 [Phlebiopsis gigantea 11061_1 CR5-6]|uniref:Cytochrome P450 n=1 Tax=Phlebiopsis gigantea (strain 11061_1 CR5-6) TaxID=745531 RepID=A0A0C3PAS3_PHLG1|nr:hypothetical protein PHLGIDRAFT_131022 [Phlebiopsis gigantea 11061_1 CR5-6]